MLKQFRASLLGFATLCFMLLAVWQRWPKLYYDAKTYEKIVEARDLSVSVHVASMSSNAYVTLLSSDEFLPGTLVLIESLKHVETRNDILVLVLSHIGKAAIEELKSAGAIVVPVNYIVNPFISVMVTKRQVYNFAKLNAWLLCDYDRLILLDSDIIVMDSIDHLFDIPIDSGNETIYAVENYFSPFSAAYGGTGFFNSGLMVIRPSVSTFKDMINSFFVMSSPNGGDQGFLNQYYVGKWEPLNTTYNVNKLLFKYESTVVKQLDKVRVLHFVRAKPWFDIFRYNELRKDFQISDRTGDYANWNSLWKCIHYKIRKHTATHPIDISNPKSILFFENGRTHQLKVMNRFCPRFIPSDCFEESPTIRNITITTHLSFDRLDRLEILASQWEGYISATIWVPKERVDDFMLELTFSNVPFRRTVLTLVIQDSADLYPINILRNLAIDRSPTDVFMFIDVDFSVPRLPDITKEAMSQLSDSAVTVIPAFEALLPFCENTFVDRIEKECIQFPESKMELVSLINEGTVVSFHEWKRGQRPTNVDQWLASEDWLTIEWDYWYEPYLILSKTLHANSIWFDDRFYDRGRNKMTIAHKFHLEGIKFMVHPNLFVIHAFGQQKDRPYMKQREKVYNDFLRNTETAT